MLEIRALVLVPVTLAMGCSVPSKDIPAEHFSPARYRAYDCDQLASESARVHSRAGQIAGILDKFARNDPPLNGIAFWPEYARLKGEHAALQQAAVVRGCPVIARVRLQAPIPTRSTAP